MNQDYQLREHPSSTIRRLKALGVWAEADRLLRKIKQQHRRQLDKAGGTPTLSWQVEANKAAWDAVHDRWPPPAGTEPLPSLVEYLRTTRGAPRPSKPADLPPLPIEAVRRFDQIGDTVSLDSDIVWVYHHLYDDSVDATTAPSRGAWSLLNHARQDAARFYERLYLPVVRQLARRKAEANGPGGNVAVPSQEEERDIEALRKMLKDAVAHSQAMEI